MSNIVLRVEFMAGTKLEDAILEAKKKAAIFDVAYVAFSFNGTRFSIGRNADIDSVLERYKRQHKHEPKNNNYIIAP